MSADVQLYLDSHRPRYLKSRDDALEYATTDLWRFWLDSYLGPTMNTTYVSDTPAYKIKHRFPASTYSETWDHISKVMGGSSSFQDTASLMDQESITQLFKDVVSLGIPPYIFGRMGGKRRFE